MIKVFVYVTGLVLYQFAPNTPNAPASAVLAAGNFVHRDLGKIPGHSPQIGIGQEATAYATPAMPFFWRFSVPCVGCAAIENPVDVPFIKGLYSGATIQDNCLNGAKLSECKAPGTATIAVAGLLEFAGPWKAVALTDCGSKTYPSTFDELDRFTFINALKSWDIIGTPDRISLPMANSVLFTTEISKLTELTISDSKLEAAFERPLAKKDCAKLPGFSTSLATSCIVMAVRIGATGPDKYHGGGDLHFAALNGLFNSLPVAKDVWLPVATMMGSCVKGGAGTGGGSHCIGGIVIK